jgi:translation initiation factor 1
MSARGVYSTASGRLCPECGKPVAACVCRARAASAPPGDGVVRVRRETAGRAGKTVTTIRGLPLDAERLREMASEIKRRCATGGSAKDGVIEIQGDFGDVVVAWLRERGFVVKRAGG